MTHPARTVGILAAALAATALCLALPAWLRFGPLGLEALAYCGVACFVPGVLLAIVSGRFTGVNRAMSLMLAGTGLRIAFVLGMGLLVIQQRPALKSTEFLLGLSLFYFVALGVETWQLMADVGSKRNQSQANA
jgi:hypothetical protein